MALFTSSRATLWLAASIISLNAVAAAPDYCCFENTLTVPVKINFEENHANVGSMEFFDAANFRDTVGKPIVLCGQEKVNATGGSDKTWVYAKSVVLPAQGKVYVQFHRDQNLKFSQLFTVSKTDGSKALGFKAIVAGTKVIINPDSDNNSSQGRVMNDLIKASFLLNFGPANASKDLGTLTVIKAWF